MHAYTNVPRPFVACRGLAPKNRLTADGCAVKKPKGIARYTLLRKDVPGGKPPGPPKGSWTHVQHGPARAELKKLHVRGGRFFKIEGSTQRPYGGILSPTPGPTSEQPVEA